MQKNDSDILVLGSGMGGMSAASLLANDGYNVRVLEGDHLPGGSSSTYYRKGYLFETGATTLIGFDEGQPLSRLEQMLNISLPKQEINPAMTVWMDSRPLIRFKDKNLWIDEAARYFGNSAGQRKFWDKAFRVAETVWQSSGKNPFFPPQSLAEWFKLANNNNPLDAPVLRFGLMSVRQVMKQCNVDSPEFRAFVDEQLMITAQARAAETPFLFGAAGLTYTNYSNYYVPGGLIELIRKLQEKLESDGGELLCRQRVTSIAQKGGEYEVKTEKGDRFFAPVVISSIPVWNMPELTRDKMSKWFQKYAERYTHAWGAFTIGIAAKDSFPDDQTLHHQLHLNKPVPHIDSGSVFASFSMKDDMLRAPEGERVINISCHTKTDRWFKFGENYDDRKKETESFILEFLNHKLPGFQRENVAVVFSGTPVTWQNWIFRKAGRVGGIPQSMKRSLLDWTPAKTPFDGLFMAGDTVFPGQGIPGVTLSGINVYYRVSNSAKAGLVSASA